jgi:sulfoxide reductase heme-binding subunit YedZ
MSLRSRLSPWWFWALLAVPALPMISEAVSSTDPRIFHRLLHPSGEFSARFLIIAMMATPLSMLLRGWRGPRWLVKNRRYLGVAAFAYAALHAVFYLLDKASLDVIVGELGRFYIWTGWLAFAIFLPLAATSFDSALQRLGTWWKPLQRWTYAAALLTLLHWAALHDWNHPAAALVHFAPLIALESYRFWWNYLRPRPTRAA